MYFDIYVLIVHKPIVEAKFHNPCGRKRQIKRMDSLNFGTNRMNSLNFGTKRMDSLNFGTKGMDSLNLENHDYLLFLDINLNLRI